MWLDGGFNAKGSDKIYPRWKIVVETREQVSIRRAVRILNCAAEIINAKGFGTELLTEENSWKT